MKSTENFWSESWIFKNRWEFIKSPSLPPIVRILIIYLYPQLLNSWYKWKHNKNFSKSPYFILVDRTPALWKMNNSLELVLQTFLIRINFFIQVIFFRQDEIFWDFFTILYQFPVSNVCQNRKLKGKKGRKEGFARHYSANKRKTNVSCEPNLWLEAPK